MKKITHLLYSGLGGHGSVFFSLVKADRKKEFLTEAIFCGVEEVRADYIHQCREHGIMYQSVRKKPGLDLLSYIRIYRCFRKSGAAILFLHGTSFILPAIFYKLFHRRKKILVRETQAHHLKSRMEWIWLKLAVRFSDHLVFLTAESLEGVYRKTSARRLQKKAQIIPNGLDTELYRPVAKRDISGKVVLGMQSRLQTIKDHPTLLKAFALLLHQFPGRTLTLRIAGDGETMSALQQLAVAKGIEKQVEFCGMLNEKELLTFMQSLDIYVHATQGETMSNSIMQAMACGLPVVASNVWGVDNMIVDDKNGILYAPGNETDLCNKISSVINSEVLRQKLSENARTDAEKEYSLEKLFDRYRHLF